MSVSSRSSWSTKTERVSRTARVIQRNPILKIEKKKGKLVQIIDDLF